MRRIPTGAEPAHQSNDIAELRAITGKLGVGLMALVLILQAIQAWPWLLIPIGLLGAAIVALTVFAAGKNSGRGGFEF